MKAFFAIIALVSVLFTSGCASIFPKRVEFGQDKVEKFPVKKAAEQEVQRQAAQRAKEEAAKTLEAAIEEETSPAVIEPAKATAKLTDAVSDSLGPPLKPSAVTSAELARALDTAMAKLNKRIDGFKKDNDENIGRKIEGSGIFSVPYFVWLGIVGALLFAGWIVLKIVVSVAAAGSPPVALGLTAVRAGGKLASAAVGQLVAGGEKFKGWLKTETPELTDALRLKIEDLFHSAHKESSDSAVRELVDKLVKK